MERLKKLSESAKSAFIENLTGGENSYKYTEYNGGINPATGKEFHTQHEYIQTVLNDFFANSEWQTDFVDELRNDINVCSSDFPELVADYTEIIAFIEGLNSSIQQPYLMTTLRMRIVNTAIYLENLKTRSAWANGVKCYAFDLLNQFEEFCNCDQQNAPEFSEKTLLNGANNWQHYAEGGLGLCYDYLIAQRLCNPTELKRTQGGAKNPNSRETWLHVEARALSQAWRMLRDAWAVTE